MDHPDTPSNPVYCARVKEMFKVSRKVKFYQKKLEDKIQNLKLRYFQGLRVFGPYLFKNEKGTYRGGFMAGMRSNFGNMVYEDDSFLLSQFADDKPNGEGIMIKDTGEYYIGLFVDGMKNGHGFMDWKNDYSYEGNFRMGRMDGVGTITWGKDTTYQGEFKNDQMDGVGIHRSDPHIEWGDVSEWKHLQWYYGQMKEGKFHGIGHIHW